MIKIETKDGKVEMNMSAHTPHQEILLGLEMLVEIVVKETGLKIDTVLEDVKRIYERDNKK